MVICLGDGDGRVSNETGRTVEDTEWRPSWDEYMLPPSRIALKASCPLNPRNLLYG